MQAGQTEHERNAGEQGFGRSQHRVYILSRHERALAVTASLPQGAGQGETRLGQPRVFFGATRADAQGALEHGHGVAGALRSQIHFGSSFRQLTPSSAK